MVLLSFPEMGVVMVRALTPHHLPPHCWLSICSFGAVLHQGVYHSTTINGQIKRSSPQFLVGYISHSTPTQPVFIKYVKLRKGPRVFGPLSPTAKRAQVQAIFLSQIIFLPKML
jgi:hypothetical protein